MSDFYLFANVNFVPGKYGAWQDAYDKLAEYVWSDEPTTKSYYFGIPYDYATDFANTTLMFAFEVYNNKEGLTDVHLKSPTMGTFLKTALPTMTTGLDLAYYAEVCGFLDSPGDKRECAVMHDTRITCGSAAARDAVAAKLASLADQVKSDDGVYTWLVCRSTENDTELRLFSRFRSHQDMQRHIRTPAIEAFWKEHGQKEIATMAQRGFLPNGKGWLHR